MFWKCRSPLNPSLRARRQPGEAIHLSVSDSHHFPHRMGEQALPIVSSKCY
jgi:hypothetical protein